MEFARSVERLCKGSSGPRSKLQQCDVERWGLQGIKLRPYQLEGLSWLAERHDRAHGCILGDEMGLGKTVQSISLLLYLHCCKGQRGPFLVLCPLSVISNWQSELARFAPGLRVLSYCGGKEEREGQREEVVEHVTRQGGSWSEAGLPFHVMLAHYEVVIRDTAFLQKLPWQCLIVDEGHRLKNSSSVLYRQLKEAECDVQCGKIVDQLQAERLLDHKVQTISIALSSRSATGAIRPAVLELDTLLSELSLCSARTQLYFRFLHRRASAAGESWKDSTESAEGLQSVQEVLRSCQTSRLEQELVSKYILLEDYFMRESLSKVVTMDTCNPDGITSSMADDIFFVLQKCTRRAFSSGNVDGACAVLNNASSLLLMEYRSQLHQRLQASSTATGLGLTEMLQGKLPSSRATDRRDSDAGQASHMISLNDVEVSIDNIQKLTKELQTECTRLGSMAPDKTRRKLDSCLADFSSATVSFKELRQVGVHNVVEAVLVPALQPAVSIFSSFSHELSEEDFANYEVNDPFVQQLLAAIETTLAEVKGRLLPAVFGHVFSELTTELTVLLEQQIFSCAFNQLGGVQLDKDLRALTGYLSSHTSWPVRDKFSRLMQIATLLTLETVNELFDYWGGSMMWRLTPSEIRRVLHLRSDFRVEDVERIKLQ